MKHSLGMGFSAVLDSDAEQGAAASFLFQGKGNSQAFCVLGWWQLFTFTDSQFSVAGIDGVFLCWVPGIDWVPFCLPST